MIKKLIRNYKEIDLILSSNHRKQLLFLLIMSILVSFFEVLGLGVLLSFVVGLSNQEALFSFELIKRLQSFTLFNDSELIILLGSLIVIVYLLKVFFVLRFNFLNTRFSYEVFTDVSTKILRNYLLMPFLKFKNENTSNLIKIIMTDANRASQMINKIVILFSEILVISSIILSLMFVNFYVVISIGIILVVFFFLIRHFISNKVKLNGIKTSDQRRDMFQLVDEILLNQKVNRVMNREEICLGKYTSMSTRYANYTTKGLFLTMMPRHLIELCIVCIVICVLIVFVLSGSLKESLPALLVILTTLGRMLPSFFKVVSTYNQFKHNLESINIAKNNLNINVVKYGHEQVVFDNSLTFKGVTFSYSENSFIKDLDLNILKGKKVAIVGESGAGKSTIVSLLLGFINDFEGEILIDGKKLTESNVKSFREIVGYIPQEVYLEDTTIKDNIVLDRKFDRSLFERAINKSNLKEFIEKIDNGELAQTGQNGAFLSGGQKQRVGIARALYSDPQILVLDEATSALNEEMESQIMKDVFNISDGLTMIIITHKLDFVKNCDHIYKIEDGKIKEVTSDFIS